jgi:intron-binding protein aquarius
VRGEWDEAKQHDVLFLLSVRPPDAGQLAEMRARADAPGVMELYGLVTVRGCEVIEVKDEGAIPQNPWTQTQLVRCHPSK